MMNKCLLVVLYAIVSQTHSDRIISKPPGLRYQYIDGPDGTPYLEDSWLKVSNLLEAARFDPDRDNEYHLFTRDNPTVSQPLLSGNVGLLSQSHYSSQRKTVILIHGLFGHALAESNVVLVPAFLASGDLNVIVVDWSKGAMTDASTAWLNVEPSGRSVARFINWIVRESGQTAEDIIINGFSLGGQKARLVAHEVQGNVSFVTVMDPPIREHFTVFGADYGRYTEVIHTAISALGLERDMAHIHFYPNGGDDMPGCGGIYHCNHARAFFYVAESLVSGGFTGVECATHEDAAAGSCNLEGRLNLGGLKPKTGSRGIYYLTTNAASPFSKG